MTLDEIAARVSELRADGAKAAMWRTDEVESMVAALRAVEAVHRRYGLYELEDSCEDTSDKHREEHHHECSDDIGEFYCDQLPVGDMCDECRDEDGERMDWPCPTITAIREAMGA